MCFNFTPILINLVGSINLHDSLETFSIITVWQLRTAKGIWLLDTTKGKKCSTFAKETLNPRTIQHKTKTEYEEYIVHQGPLLQY